MNHFISLPDAAEMTALFRQNRQQVLQVQHQGMDLLPICETFDRGAIESLLNQEGCQQIRIYYGMRPDLTVHAIIVAADSEGRDILPAANSLAGKGDEGIIQNSQRCPVICPPGSPLNS